MKNGMAIREKTSIPPKNCWPMTLRRDRSPSITMPKRDVESSER
jgi:hypothetical protein